MSPSLVIYQAFVATIGLDVFPDLQISAMFDPCLSIYKVKFIGNADN